MSKGFLPTEYLCLGCKKIKPWYRFVYGVVEENAICFNCNTKGYNIPEIAEKYLLQNRIKKLANSAMKNKMSDLRNHLFETLEKVKDGDCTTERAKSICEIAQAIINSAKVEVDYIKAIGGKAGSQFMQLENGVSEKPSV